MTMTTESLDAAIGERVHQLMWRQRVTVTTLARALGVSQPTLSRKLRGERPWYAGEISAAADYLAVPVGDLFGRPRQDSNLQPTDLWARAA